MQIKDSQNNSVLLTPERTDSETLKTGSQQGKRTSSLAQMVLSLGAMAAGASLSDKASRAIKQKFDNQSSPPEPDKESYLKPESIEVKKPKIDFEIPKGVLPPQLYPESTAKSMLKGAASTLSAVSQIPAVSQSISNYKYNKMVDMVNRGVGVDWLDSILSRAKGRLVEKGVQLDLSTDNPITKIMDDVASSNDYVGKNYAGESFSTLFQKANNPIGLSRLLDYTINKTAEQIPLQIAIVAGLMTGAEVPVLAGMGLLGAAGKFREDTMEHDGILTEAQMAERAMISGASEVLTEGFSAGLFSFASKVFSSMGIRIGRIVIKGAIKNSLMAMAEIAGESAEEVANDAVNALSDKYYKVKEMSIGEFINQAWDTAIISAVTAGLVSMPTSYANSLADTHLDAIKGNRDNLPTYEELVAQKKILETYNNGLTNENGVMISEPHIVSGDVSRLLSQINDMIDGGFFKDREGEINITDLADEIKSEVEKQIASQEGYVRMAGGYSNLAEVVNAKIPGRATPEQILKTLENAGVSKEEVEDMDLFNWLQGKETVTKKELQDYLEGNDIQIQEVAKGGAEEEKAIEIRLEELAQEQYGKSFKDLKDDEQDEIRDTASELDERGTFQKEFTKFQQYQLRGGENYREVLLKLPTKPPEEGMSSNRGNFISGHWEEPNVLAHIRLNDRMIDGKNTLFMEEVQSDWHQMGRKHGYGKAQREVGGWLPMSDKGVPDAPFKKTWHELALKRILRMAVEEGYDQIAWTTGEQQNDRYDLSKEISAITWQKDKFPSDPNLKVIRIEPKNSGLIRISVMPDGIVIKDPTATFHREAEPLLGKRLDEVVGKEVADKILKDEEGGLTGNGLKLGGEGMKGFYDQMIPSFLNKYTKKWGGRVGETDIPVRDIWQTESEKYQPGKIIKQKVHSLEITPSMKKSIGKGQPIYGTMSRMTGQEGMARIGKEKWEKDVETNLPVDPEQIKNSSSKNDIELAISQINRDMRDIIASEADLIEDYGSNFKGGVSYGREIDEASGKQIGKGLVSKIPENIKHPRTGAKPTNKKQWRELAIENLIKGNSISNQHDEYKELKEQKNYFLKRLADIEMAAASEKLSDRENATPKQIEEMSKEEREWFNLNRKQADIFDDVPPSHYGNAETAYGGIDASELKDISGLDMHMKDFYRNFEKVFGKHIAAAEKDLLSQLDSSVNEFVNFEKRMTDAVKKDIIDGLGIKKASEESRLLQLFGEGQITEEQLREFAKDKADAIIKAERWFRSKYDEMLDKVNSSRRRIYPNNPDKLVPRRNNYFRHFKEMAGSFSLKNLFDKPNNIASELAGLSQFTQPKSKWASFMQQRLGIETEIDAVGGFLNYIPAAGHAIYVDPMIPKIRALEKYLRVATHDTRHLNNFIEYLMMYANDLAGKTNVWDRAAQQLLGRNTMRALSWMTQRVKKNLILYNISSTITQISNLPQAVGKTKLYFVVGAQDYMKSIFVKGGVHEKSEFINTRYKDDIYGAFDPSIKSAPKRLASWLLQAFDEVGTKMTWYAFYDQAIANKVENPIRQADIWTRKMVAGRGLHEVPLAQKSRLMQLMAPFMIETQNLWYVLGDMSKDKDVIGLALFSIAAWILNSGLEMLKGYRVIFDPIDMLNQAFSGKKTIPQRVGRILGEITQNIPFGRQLQGFYPEYGFSYGKYKFPTRQQFFGDSDRTRYGSSILAIQTITDPLFMLFPPFGGQQLKRTLKGLDALDKGYVEVNRKKIPIGDSSIDKLKAVVFGPSSMKNVREAYKKLANKEAKNKRGK